MFIINIDVNKFIIMKLNIGAQFTSVIASIVILLLLVVDDMISTFVEQNNKQIFSLKQPETACM